MRLRTAIVGLAIIAVVVPAGYLVAQDLDSRGPTCDELNDAQVRTDLVWDIDRELIPPGSPDDDPLDTAPSERRKFRRAISSRIVAECHTHPGDYRPREPLLRDLEQT